MGIFDKVSDAKANGAFSYFEDAGVYETTVKNCSSFLNRKQQDVIGFTFQIDKVISGNQNYLGMEKTYLFRVSEYPDSAPGACKQFIMGITGSGEDEMTTENLERIFSEEQPLAGLKCKLTLIVKITKKGNNFMAIKGDVL